MSTTLDFKRKVVAEVIRLKEKRLVELQTAQSAQLSDAHADDIDLADPVESTRQQMLEEAEFQSEPIEFIKQQLDVLKAIRTDEPHDAVTSGSLVHTNIAYLLIGAAQEQFDVEGKKVIGLSTDAPVFKKMEGLKGKAELHFGNAEYVILDIV